MSPDKAPVVRIPLFPLDLALLPGEEIQLHIFEPRYRKMVGRCMQEDSPFGILRLHEGVMSEVGCEARVLKVLRRYPDGRFDIAAQGGDRFDVRKVHEHSDGYLEGDVVRVADSSEHADYTLEDRLEERYRKYAATAGDIPAEPPPRGPRWSFRVAERMRLSADLRQQLLEMRSEKPRLVALLEYIDKLIPWLEKREQGQALIRGNGRLHPGMEAPKE